MPDNPSRLPASTFVLGTLAILSGILIAFVSNPLVSLLPLGFFVAWRFLPLFGEKADQHFLIGFLILCFLIDDISQVAWGRSVDTWTENLGIILFESFGMTGLEAFGLLFAAWLVLVRPKAQIKRWFELGVLPLLLISSSVFVSSALAGIVGLQSGGAMKTYFIQTRFLHILPFWSFIGFVVIRDAKIVSRLIVCLTVMISLKSFQALFVYLTNREVFVDAEYLVDHYYSAFAVIAFVGLVVYLLKEKNWVLRIVIVASMGAIAAAYFLNDRRTSYVGVVFALGLLAAFLPFAWLKRYFPKMLAAGLALAIFTAATWNAEPPLGFIGATYRSFGTEEGEGSGPSYRDLENANLLNAVAQAPLTGIGYGKEFDEPYPMPDISMVYDRYRMIPHNLFLASWAFGGPLTITAVSLLFVFMIAQAGRLIGRGPGSAPFFLGLIALFYFLQYLSYTFGDLGLQITRNQMLAGLFLGACYRLLRDGQTKEALCKPI